MIQNSVKSHDSSAAKSTSGTPQQASDTKENGYNKTVKKQLLYQTMATENV